MKTMQYNLIRRVGEVCCVAALAQTAALSSAVADTFYLVRDKAEVLSLDGT